jgi:hypothetical protein
MASGYVVYLGRSIGKHKMMDHTTDMLRAIIAAALRARDLGESMGDDEIEMMWVTANPSREQATWSAPWGQSESAGKPKLRWREERSRPSRGQPQQSCAS